MTSPRVATGIVFILAALAMPSLAQANVGDSLARADQALESAAVAAEGGDAAAFGVYARENQKASAKAERQARKAPKAKRTKLLRRATAQHDANLDEYASLIESVPTALQAHVAGAAASSAEARGKAVETLMALAGTLPEPAGAALLDVIAAFHVDGDVETLIEALMSDEVIASVRETIQQTIALVGAQLDAVLAHLEELEGILPPGVADMIAETIAMVKDRLAGIGTLIDELLGGHFGVGALCDFLPTIPIC